MIPQTKEEIDARMFWERLAEILKDEDTTLAEIFRNNKKPLLTENMKRYRNIMPSEKYIQTIADYIGVTSDFILKGNAIEAPVMEIIYPEREKAIARMVKLYREATEENWTLSKHYERNIYKQPIEDEEGIPFYAPYSIL